MRDAVVDILGRVGLSPEILNRYPHEFSGGQRQRICIARALAVSPEMIVADEPLSALDVSIQAQILNLLQDLKERTKISFLFISHDLRVVKYFSDAVGVMYLGKIVEYAKTDELFEMPLHPYTQGLLAAVPHLAAMSGRKPARSRLQEIPGSVPALVNLPQGCTFAPRCAFASDVCRNEFPPYRSMRPGHSVACWHADKLQGNQHA
jgi:oligopeptide/dipeptide ABC transporter ATP-binding protein